MPKKSNAPDGAARPSIPWRIRVRKDEEFRPLSVSMEGTFLRGDVYRRPGGGGFRVVRERPGLQDALPDHVGGRAGNGNLQNQ